MLSHRRTAQLGLLSASLVMATSMVILFRGNPDSIHSAPSVEAQATSVDPAPEVHAFMAYRPNTVIPR